MPINISRQDLSLRTRWNRLICALSTMVLQTLSLNTRERSNHSYHEQSECYWFHTLYCCFVLYNRVNLNERYWNRSITLTHIHILTIKSRLCQYFYVISEHNKSIWKKFEKWSWLSMVIRDVLSDFFILLLLFDYHDRKNYPRKKNFS